MDVRDHLSYRGYEIDLYYDVEKDVYCCDLAGETFYLLTYDNEGFTDLKIVIDDILDTITRFPNYKGAKLEWFQNGKFRDIRLVQDHRMLYIFLVDEVNPEGIPEIVQKSEQILEAYAHKQKLLIK